MRVRSDAVQRSNGWTPDHQYLHSLIWSAFLDLDYYTADRALRRFRPYSTEWILAELFWCEEMRDLGIVRQRSVDESVEQFEELAALALWTIAPNAFDDRMRVGQGGGRARRVPDDEEERKLCKLREILRREFAARLQLEYVATPLEPDERSLLPPLLDCRIGHTKVEARAGRRSAAARVTCDLQIPYLDLRRAIDPGNWGVCGFWQPTERTDGGGEQRLKMQLWLPGGKSISRNKCRSLGFELVESKGPFGSRIDYRAEEIARQDEDDDDPDDREYVSDRKGQKLFGSELHIGGIRGFVALEKIPGRPGFTRFVADRWVRFESPNHDRFRAETLMYWHAVELISFVRAVRPSQGVGVPG